MLWSMNIECAIDSEGDPTLALMLKVVFFGYHVSVKITEKRRRNIPTPRTIA